MTDISKPAAGDLAPEFQLQDQDGRIAHVWRAVTVDGHAAAVQAGPAEGS